MSNVKMNRLLICSGANHVSFTEMNSPNISDDNFSLINSSTKILIEKIDFWHFSNDDPPFKTELAKRKIGEL